MIVWGTYVTKKVIETGQFYCPGCAQHRSYNLRRPKKWGHLYWIPIIPMEELDRYVECTACNKAWNESVLKHDPVRDRQQRDEKLSMMIAQVMVLMSREDRLSFQLANGIATAAKTLIGTELTPETIFGVASKIKSPADVLSNVEEQSGDLTDRGKELVLRAALSAAPALDEQSRALATQVGHRLGMTSAHITGVLAEVSTS
jgi:hypothetical protein